jgi:hypothetical protein
VLLGSRSFYFLPKPPLGSRTLVRRRGQPGGGRGLWLFWVVHFTHAMARRAMLWVVHQACFSALGFQMKRREFITLLGGAAAAWPLAARAQQPERMRRIGILLPAAADDVEFQARVGAFLQGLQQSGWSIGRNVRIDTRWATANAVDLRRHAAELAALAPDVILAHGAAAVGAMLQATHTVPIVFPVAGDPVAAGFVDSLARPGGKYASRSARRITVRLPSLWKGSARERSKALILVNPRDEKREALAGENAKAFGSNTGMAMAPEREARDSLPHPAGSCGPWAIATSR